MNTVISFSPGDYLGEDPLSLKTASPEINQSYLVTVSEK